MDLPNKDVRVDDAPLEQMGKGLLLETDFIGVKGDSAIFRIAAKNRGSGQELLLHLDQSALPHDWLVDD